MPNHARQFKESSAGFAIIPLSRLGLCLLPVLLHSEAKSRNSHLSMTWWEHNFLVAKTAGLQAAKETLDLRDENKTIALKNYVRTVRDHTH